MRKRSCLTILIVSLALLVISAPAMAVHVREEAGPNVFSEISEKVSMSGLVIFDYYWGDLDLRTGAPAAMDANKGSSSNFVTMNVILDFDAEVNDWVNVFAALYYEEAGVSYVTMYLEDVLGHTGEDEGLTWDEAVITLGNTEEFPLYFSAGKMFVPFGVQQTHMVHDPLVDAPVTLIFGETQRNAILLGAELDGLSVSVCTFKGHWDNNVGSQFSVDANYALEPLKDEVDAYAAYLHIGIAGAFFEAEYMDALDKFDPVELDNGNGKAADPSVLNLEAGYSFEVMGKSLEIVAKYAMTDDLLVLPEERYGICAHLGIFPNTTLSAGYCHDNFDKDNYLGIDEVDLIVSQLTVHF
ncbi:MAG: LbtU family siderophore porin [Deltaproteobacteria bacterium]|nr:LbtU family siderophore porin [Deltaproteobacteria bacterium]